MYQKYGNLHFAEGTSRDKEIEICNKNIETLGGHLIPETEKRGNSYFRMYKFLQKFSIITFVLAIFLLSCFTMKTITSIIY